jgi:hypothetical protein
MTPRIIRTLSSPCPVICGFGLLAALTFVHIDNLNIEKLNSDASVHLLSASLPPVSAVLLQRAGRGRKNNKKKAAGSIKNNEKSKNNPESKTNQESSLSKDTPETQSTGSKTNQETSLSKTTQGSGSNLTKASEEEKHQNDSLDSQNLNQSGSTKLSTNPSLLPQIVNLDTPNLDTLFPQSESHSGSQGSRTTQDFQVFGRVSDVLKDWQLLRGKELNLPKLKEDMKVFLGAVADQGNHNDTNHINDNAQKFKMSGSEELKPPARENGDPALGGEAETEFQQERQFIQEVMEASAENNAVIVRETALKKKWMDYFQLIAKYEKRTREHYEEAKQVFQLNSADGQVVWEMDKLGDLEFEMPMGKGVQMGKEASQGSKEDPDLHLLAHLNDVFKQAKSVSDDKGATRLLLQLKNPIWHLEKVKKKWEAYTPPDVNGHGSSLNFVEFLVEGHKLAIGGKEVIDGNLNGCDDPIVKEFLLQFRGTYLEGDDEGGFLELVKEVASWEELFAVIMNVAVRKTTSYLTILARTQTSKINVEISWSEVIIDH